MQGFRANPAFLQACPIRARPHKEALMRTNPAYLITAFLVARTFVIARRTFR